MVLPRAFNFLAPGYHTTVVHMPQHQHNSVLYAIQHAFGYHDRVQIGKLQQMLPNNAGPEITSDELTTLGSQLEFFPITLVSTYQRTSSDTSMVDIDRTNAEETRQYQLFRNGGIPAVVFMRSGSHYDLIEQSGSRFVAYDRLHPEIRHYLQRPYHYNRMTPRTVDSVSSDDDIDSGGDTTDTEPGIGRYAYAPARGDADDQGVGDTTETVPYSSGGDTTDTDIDRQIQSNVQERHSRYMDRNNHVTVDILNTLARRYQIRITGPVNKHVLSLRVSRYEIMNGIRPFNETEGNFDIRSILDHRLPNQSRTETEFLIEWVGYPHESDHTWEPASGISRRLRDQYFRQLE